MKSDGGQLGPDEIGGQASQQPVLLKEGQLRTHRRQGHDRRSAWRVRFSHAGVKPKPVPLISHYRHLAPTYGRRLCDVAEPAPQSALLGPSVDSFGQARRYRDGDSAELPQPRARRRVPYICSEPQGRIKPGRRTSLGRLAFDQDQGSADGRDRFRPLSPASRRDEQRLEIQLGEARQEKKNAAIGSDPITTTDRRRQGGLNRRLGERRSQARFGYLELAPGGSSLRGR